MSPLDYQIGDDAGTNEAASIEPVENGQDANETTFQRPTEHIRTRTENIRKNYDLLEMLAPSDLGFQVVSSPDARLHWATGGSGNTFSIDDGAGGVQDMYLIPLLSTANVTAPPGDPVRATYYYDDGGGNEFQLVAKNTIYAHNGGNSLYIHMYNNTVDSLVVTVIGDSGGGTYPEDGPVVIDVALASGGSTLNAVVAAIEAAAGTYLDTTASQVISGGTNNVDPVALIPFYLGDAGSKSAVDAVGIKIGGGAGDGLAQFFGSGGMLEGDALVIDFTDVQDRLNNTLSDTITSAMFKIINDGSQNLAKNGIVPLAKVMDGDLYFINGCVYEVDKPAPLFPGLKDNAMSVAISDTPQSLAAGTTHAQMTEMLAHYNAHVDGTQDDHVIKDITRKPYVVVGVSGDTTADYDSLSTALTAIAGTGGTVFLKEGTHSITTLDLPAATAALIRIIGASDTGGGGGIRATLSVSSKIEVSAVSLNAKYVFSGIRFEHTGGDYLFDFPCTSFGNMAGVQFVDCKFESTLTTWGAATEVGYIHTCVPVKMSSCIASANTSAIANDVAIVTVCGESLEDAARGRRIEIDKCFFSSTHHVLRLGSANDDSGNWIGDIKFTNNVLYNTGYDDGAGDYAATIYSYSATKYADMVISENLFDGPSASYKYTVCDVHGKGIIERNTVNLSPVTGGGTGPTGIIKVEAAGYTGAQVVVAENILTATVTIANAIEVSGGNCVVRDNQIASFTGYGATSAAITTAGGQVTGNTITSTASIVAAARGITIATALAYVRDNTIVSATSGNFSYGIYTGVAAVIRGNVLLGNGDTDVGIYSDVGGCVIDANTVSAYQAAITAGDEDVVTGNILTSTSTTAAGISLGVGCTATGNELTVTGNTTVGIRLSGTCTVTGNKLKVASGTGTIGITNLSATTAVDNSTIGNNSLSGFQYSVRVVGSVDSDHTTICGNTIVGDAADSSVGVVLQNALHTSVLGNSISAVENGVIVDTGSEYTAITGNNISQARTDSKGVVVVEHNQAIVGNMFYSSDTTAGTAAIDATSKNYVAIGNNIRFGYAAAAINTGGTDVGMGPTGTVNLDHNHKFA